MPAAGAQQGLPLFLLFLIMKMFGYCLAVIPLARIFQRPQMQSFIKAILFGFVRLLLGVAIALSTFSIINYFHIERPLMVYLGIYPLRVVEWYLLLWFCFDYQMAEPTKLFKWALIAALYSYLLDIVAIGVVLAVGRLLS